MSTVASTDAVQLALHDLGGEGPTILYSHATGLHGLLWAPLARSLPGYHGVAVDYRGHGDATAPSTGSYDWGGFRDDCIAVVDALGDAGPLLGVGHSMGGAVLVMTELMRPGTFRALALYEPIVFPPGRGDEVGSSPITEGARRRRPEFPSREAARANFASKPPLDVLDPEVLDIYVAEGFRATSEGAVRLKCEPVTEALTFTGSIGHDIHGHLAEVRCPVLVMAAPPEEGRPADFAEDVAISLPHGELHRFDDLGHFGPLEDPKAVAEVIGRFFTAQGGPEAGEVGHAPSEFAPLVTNFDGGAGEAPLRTRRRRW